MHASASAVILLHVGVNKHDENLPLDVCIRKRKKTFSQKHAMKSKRERE